MLFEFCPGGHLLNLLEKAEAESGKCSGFGTSPGSPLSGGTGLGFVPFRVVWDMCVLTA